MVRTNDGDVPADLVMLGIGVAPNSELADDAGIELGVKDSIRVDDRQETSVAGIWAAGDCAETTHLVSGGKVHIALGTYANRHGRVAGVNIGGGSAHSQPVLGTAVTKLCENEIGLTGLNSKQAAAAGFDAVGAVIESTTFAGYLPDAPPITVKFVVERGSGRLLGAQIVGGAGAAKRIDTCAMAITAGMNVEQIAELDFGYAPPFSPLWDPVADRRSGGAEVPLIATFATAIDQGRGGRRWRGTRQVSSGGSGLRSGRPAPARGPSAPRRLPPRSRPPGHR